MRPAKLMQHGQHAARDLSQCHVLGLLSRPGIFFSKQSAVCSAHTLLAEPFLVQAFSSEVQRGHWSTQEAQQPISRCISTMNTRHLSCGSDYWRSVPWQTACA